MTRIVVDGVDGSGKTTLINKIAELTGLPIIKFSAPITKNPFNEFKGFYTKGTENFKDNCIFDRTYVSEIIYGPFKGRQRLTEEQIKYFKEKTKGDLYIISQASNEFIKNSFDNRGESYISLKEAIEINRKYFEFANKNKLGKKQIFYYPEFYKIDQLNDFINKNIIGNVK